MRSSFQVVSYRDIMKIVLEYSHRSRPIISLPWWAGMVQGAVLEKLPTNMFTITRDQVSARRWSGLDIRRFR